MSKPGVDVDEDKPIHWEQEKKEALGGQLLRWAGHLILLRLLFIGCIGSALILFFGLFSNSNLFQFVQNIWTIMFCLSLVIIEEEFLWSHVPRFLILLLRKKLLQSFNCLTRAWGKGALAIYIGSIMLAKWKFLDIISGIYMLTVGSLLIIFGRYAESKYKKLMKKLISLATADKNNDGKIDKKELHKAAIKSGAPMTDVAFFLGMALLETH